METNNEIIDTVPYQVRLPKKFIAHARQQGLDVANLLRRAAMSHTLQKEAIEIQIKELQDEIQRLTLLLTKNPISELYELTVEEINALRDAKRVISEKGEQFIYGQRKVFNAKFDRDLTITEFRYFLKDL